MTATLTKELRKLTTTEKLRLAESLWDQVSAEGETMPVPESHKRVLNRRLADHLKAPASALSLGEFRERLAKRL